MKQPNIILISIDTLRADHLSCYGYPRETTPCIDRLAREGTIFLRNFSTGVWTPPGHASMLTGLYVHEHGVYDDRKLAANIPTIATVLKSSGYQTAGFVNNSQVGELVGFNKGHDIYEEVWKGISPKSTVERLIKGVYRKVREYSNLEDMGANKTCMLFKKWLRSVDLSNRPFYAFLHFIEPHNPLKPPRGYKEKFIGHKAEPGINRGKIDRISHNPLICYLEDLNPNEREVQYIKDVYDGEILYTDRKIGWIIDFLKTNHCYDNTLIIITSDHGEHFGEHGMWSHVASLYKEVLHVPLIIKFPVGTDIVKEVTRHTQLIDIFPTIMDAAGISKVMRDNVSGISLLNDDGKKQYHQYVFAEWEGRIPSFILDKINSHQYKQVDLTRLKMKMSMIQDEHYKYIMKEEGEAELFDISENREQKIGDLPDAHEIQSRLHSELLHNQGKRRYTPQELRYEVDDQIAENLKSLGYM